MFIYVRNYFINRPFGGLNTESPQINGYEDFSTPTHFFGKVRRQNIYASDHFQGEEIFQLFGKGVPEPILYSKLSTSGEYIISSSSEISTVGTSFVGSVRSNLAGTEFIIYDNGVSGGFEYSLPQLEQGSSLVLVPMFPAKLRKKLGLIIYESNIFGTQPRTFEIVFPRPEFFNEDLDIDKLFYAGDFSKLIILKNKTPVWNPGLTRFGFVN